MLCVARNSLEYENPFDVGMTGLVGFSSGYHAMEECDLLLLLGTDFPYRELDPKDATIIQVDLRGDHIGRRTRVDVPLLGTVQDTVDALLPRLKPERGDGHLLRMRQHYVETRMNLDVLAANDHDRAPSIPSS